MRFPTKPKPQILDESFLDEAPRGSQPATADAEKDPPPPRRPRRRASAKARPVEKAGPDLTHKSFRLPAALARRLEALARVTTKSQTEIVLEGTEVRLAELEDEYRRRTGQRVPSIEIVRID